MKMNPIRNALQRVTALALCLVLLLAGCSSKTEGTLSPSKGKTPMGRYLEKEIAFSQPIAQIFNIHQNKAGELEMFCYLKISNTKVDPAILISKDKGAAWEKKEVPWLKEMNSLKNIGFNALAWDKEDTPYLYYYEYSSAEDIIPHFASVDQAGALVDLPFEVPSDESGSNARSIQIAQNGDFLFDCHFSLLQVDAKTGAVKYTYYPEEGLSIDSFLLIGTIAYLASGDSIKSYSLEDGSPLPDIPLNTSPKSLDGESLIQTYAELPESPRVLAADETGSLLFADNNGIFRCPAGSSTLERIVDGSLTSLPSPSLSRSSMLAVGTDYLIFSALERNMVLFSYTYSSEVPTLPEKELTIFSLEDNLTIREAMGAFQRKNPNVHLNYQIGVFQNSGATLTDTLRAFSTELLAGKGADVMVLDGMPILSYREKGVLLDLSETLDPLMNSGQLLSNTSASYRGDDGSLYAIPARFQVPMMTGEPKAVSSVQSLSEMLRWLEQEKENYISPFASTLPRDLLNFFYPVCAPSMSSGKGLLDESQLSAFLKDLKSIRDLDPIAGLIKDTTLSRGYSIDFDTLPWLKNAYCFSLGSVKSFTDLFPIGQKVKEREGDCTSLFHQSYFQPSTVLAVNSKSAQPDLASDFIQFVLSDEVQSHDLHDGLPVAAQSFEGFTDRPEYLEEDPYSGSGTSYLDRSGTDQFVSLLLSYPAKDFIKEKQKLFRSLKPLPIVDEIVLSIITDESAGYFSGSEALDSAVARIMQKLKLYQSE